MSLDLFSGCGGFSYGFERAGFHIKYAIDNNKLVQETFEYNHPNTEFIFSDIYDQDPNNYKDCNIIIGSPPCQQFSTANISANPDKGMKLIYEFLKWIEIIKPKYWIMENVPGVMKFLKWRIKDFKIPKIKILNCADYGIPQTRKRCFSGKYVLPSITHNSDGRTDLFGKRLKKYISVRQALNNSFKGDIINRSSNFTKKHIINIDKPSKNITTKNDCILICNARSLNNKGNQPYNLINNPNQCLTTSSPMIVHKKGKLIIKIRTFNIEEMAKLQSFPQDFKFFGTKTNQYKMIGNAVPPLMAYHLAKSL